jgi:hypothetical protein
VALSPTALGTAGFQFAGVFQLPVPAGSCNVAARREKLHTAIAAMTMKSALNLIFVISVILLVEKSQTERLHYTNARQSRQLIPSVFLRIPP